MSVVPQLEKGLTREVAKNSPCRRSTCNALDCALWSSPAKAAAIAG
ncbi:hypothetical protein [Escherichia coli]|nr:hypothetical protein [Escherichia coli]